MLPILVTVGHGLLWFAATMGQLAVWGMGVGLGYWFIGKVTHALDAKLAGKFASKWEQTRETVKRHMPGGRPVEA